MSRWSTGVSGALASGIVRARWGYALRASPAENACSIGAVNRPRSVLANSSGTESFSARMFDPGV